MLKSLPIALSKLAWALGTPSFDSYSHTLVVSPIVKIFTYLHSQNGQDPVLDDGNAAYD